MRNVKQMTLKITYYFFNDMINIKDFYSSLLKVDKSRTKKLVFKALNILQLIKLIMKIYML